MATADLEPWQASKLTVTGDGALQEVLGDLKYQRPLVDYFQSRLGDFQGDWNGLLFYYLLDVDRPLFGGLVGSCMSSLQERLAG